MRWLTKTTGLCTVLISTLPAFAQSTAFTYQGRLNSLGAAANGSYDLNFALFDSASAGNQQGGALTNAAAAVSNGLFTVTLDFGNQFPGANRWLEITVRTNGSGAFATLIPRQPLTPTPYAVTAGSLVSGGLASGTYGNAVTLNNPANNINGMFAGNGANVTNVNAGTLNGLTSASFWRTTGNAGTSPGTHFLGTTDNQPVEIKVNGRRALRLEPTSDGPYLTNQVNVIAGSPANFVPNGVHAATIAGGGAESDGFTPYRNSVSADYGTVGGGILNNSVGSGATVAGGVNNNGNGDLVTISGGSANWSDGIKATIGGGDGNMIWGGAESSTIGGGSGNSILEGGRYGTIPGGANNSATNFAFAAGYRAQAIHTGAFVWADLTSADFASTRTNQFNVRANGGLRFVTAGAGLTLDGQPVLTGPGVVGTSSSLGSAAVSAVGAGSSGTALQISSGGIKVLGAGIGTSTPVFVHRATGANIEAGATHRTTITHPLCDGDPNAILIITHNYNPSLTGNVLDAHPTSVFYHSGLGKWQIYHDDFVAMTTNSAWNVLIVKQ